MSKRDVLDPDLARRFAWRIDAPDDAATPPAPDDEPALEDEDEDVDPEAEKARWAQARRLAAELAQDVDRAWAMTARAAQTTATASLLQRARRSNDVLVCLRDHPNACLRLWRLVVRHFRRLSPRAQNEEVIGLVGMRPPLDVAETADLLAEIIASRVMVLRVAMNHVLQPRSHERRHPDIGARLARLVAEGKTWSAREAAATWLSDDDLDAAIPALRRAVRQPRIALRARALSLLAKRTPPVLDAEEVLWLLQDAHAHPLLEAEHHGETENAKAYAEALLAVTVATRPAEGFRPLLEMVPWRCVRDEGLAGVDAPWALRVLAAAYPREGRATIERELLQDRIGGGEAALEAIALLPDDAARPLLLEAAARPRRCLAERAKAIWFERFGEACPVGPLDGVPLSLLDGPPSERLLAAVTVLRGGSPEAQGAMLDAMLEEAPARGAPLAELSPARREALALWIFAARDVPFRTGRPRHPSAIADLLAERFGEAAFDGLALLAERDARAGLDFRWLVHAADLVKKLGLGEAARDRLRAIARVGLASPSWEGATGPVDAIHAAGVTPDTADLLLAITSAPEADGGGRHFDAAFSAYQTLSHAREVPGLEEKLDAAARRAREAGAWSAFGRIVGAGCWCGFPSAVRLVMEVIDTLDASPEAREGVDFALSGLKGKADRAWLLGHLHRPASLAFAAVLALVDESADLAELSALRTALASDAREGAAAAEAARKLLRVGAIGAEDRRLDGILERAPAPERAELAAALLHREAPIAPIRRYLLDLLATCEWDVVAPIFWSLEGGDPPGKKELFEDAVPLATDAKVRAELESELGEPREEETYWQYADGEVDEDDAEADEELV